MKKLIKRKNARSKNASGIKAVFSIQRIVKRSHYPKRESAAITMAEIDPL